MFSFLIARVICLHSDCFCLELYGLNAKFHFTQKHCFSHCGREEHRHRIPFPKCTQLRKCHGTLACRPRLWFFNMLTFLGVLGVCTFPWTPERSRFTLVSMAQANTAVKKQNDQDIQKLLIRFLSLYPPPTPFANFFFQESPTRA